MNKKRPRIVLAKQNFDMGGKFALLDENGDVQYTMKGGNRVVSIDETEQIIDGAQGSMDNRTLGRYMAGVISRQNSRSKK